MNRSPSINIFNSLALREFMSCVCLSPIVGIEAWGEDAQPQSSTLQEIIDLTLTHPRIVELDKSLNEETGIPPRAIRVLWVCP